MPTADDLAQLTGTHTAPEQEHLPHHNVLDRVVVELLTGLDAEEAARIQGDGVHDSRLDVLEQTAVLFVNGQGPDDAGNVSVATGGTGTGGTGSAPDATSGIKGVIRLGGDLGGTAQNPTVPGLTQRATTAQLTALTTDTALALGGKASQSALDLIAAQLLAATPRQADAGNIQGAVTVSAGNRPGVIRARLVGLVSQLTITDLPPAPYSVTLLLVQDEVGDRLVTLPASWRWDGGVAGQVSQNPGSDTALEVWSQPDGIRVGVSGRGYALASSLDYTYSFAGVPNGPVPAADWLARPGVGTGSAVAIDAERLRLTVGTSGSGDGCRVDWVRDTTVRRGWEVQGKYTLGSSVTTFGIDLSYTGTNPSYYELRITPSGWSINKRTTFFSQVGATVSKSSTLGAQFNFSFRLTETGDIEASVWDLGQAKPATPQFTVTGEASRASIPAGILAFLAFGQGTVGGNATVDDIIITPGTV